MPPHLAPGPAGARGIRGSCAGAAPPPSSRSRAWRRGGRTRGFSLSCSGAWRRRPISSVIAQTDSKPAHLVPTGCHAGIQHEVEADGAFVARGAVRRAVHGVARAEARPSPRSCWVFAPLPRQVCCRVLLGTQALGPQLLVARRGLRSSAGDSRHSRAGPWTSLQVGSGPLHLLMNPLLHVSSEGCGSTMRAASPQRCHDHHGTGHAPRLPPISQTGAVAWRVHLQARPRWQQLLGLVRQDCA